MLKFFFQGEVVTEWKKMLDRVPGCRGGYDYIIQYLYYILYIIYHIYIIGWERPWEGGTSFPDCEKYPPPAKNLSQLVTGFIKGTVSSPDWNLSSKMYLHKGTHTKISVFYYTLDQTLKHTYKYDEISKCREKYLLYYSFFIHSRYNTSECLASNQQKWLFWS